jgi:hypothetical protein
MLSNFRTSKASLLVRRWRRLTSIMEEKLTNSGPFTQSTRKHSIYPLLLQTRVKTLNCKLGSVFRRWYSDFPVEKDGSQAA